MNFQANRVEKNTTHKSAKAKNFVYKQGRVVKFARLA